MTKMTPIEKAQQIIEKSGNNFHCKVINYFKNKGWYVLVSPYFTDNVSSKSREIDLIVEKIFQTSDGTVNVKLYIECKYIPNINVFWFSSKNFFRAKKIVPNPAPQYSANSYTKDHRYIKDERRVATLFATDNDKKTENELVYTALNQSLNAMIYHRKVRTAIPNHSQLKTRYTIEYPVIVFNNFDNFFRADVDDDVVDPKQIIDNFQLEVNYAYLDSNSESHQEYFLIDMLDFKRLDEYLSVIEEDVQTVKNYFEN